MLELFRDPNEFFRNRMNEPEDLKRPLYIILGLWLARLFMLTLVSIIFISHYSSNSAMDLSSITSGMYMFFAIILLMILIISLIGILIMWITTAGVFYLFSAIFRGTGSFKRILEFTSYGFIPYIIDTLLTPVYLWLLIPEIDLIAIIENMDKTGDTSMFVHELIYANIPLNVFSTLLSIALFGLALYIWMNGMKHGRNLSTKQAILTVGIPAVFYATYEVLKFIIYFI
nr:Yip1 family protein [uncultured Methanolobus sp.]